MNLFILETERLRIIPLSHSQLVNYLRVDGSLEEQLGINFLKRKIEPQLIEAFEEIILPSVGNPSRNYLFCTLWTIVEKERNIMVGDLCFKGEPNLHGEVEIGYGTYPPFQNRGYMTEAVKAVCQWAFQQAGVSCIKAETDSINRASQKILEKIGFSISSSDGNDVYWSLTKSQTFLVERA